MIFLSVGTQEPFDRLVRAVDCWAALHPDQPVFGQVGALAADSYRPLHFSWQMFVPAAEYQQRLAECRVLVAHVGMGSIISALTAGTPLVMLPRRAALGEHRNEHQLATARRFRGRAGLHVAEQEEEVGPLLDHVLADGEGHGGSLPPYADERLLAALRSFIQAGG